MQELLSAQVVLFVCLDFGAGSYSFDSLLARYVKPVRSTKSKGTIHTAILHNTVSDAT